jgi:hypothetical protein
MSRLRLRPRPRALALALALAGVAGGAAAAVALSRGGATDPAPAVVVCEGAAALQFECFERRSVALVRARGAAPALRDLARQRARNGYVRAACHQLTHRAGRAAGALDGIRAFADGDPMCSSGYYHGVVEAVMERIGAARVVKRAQSVCAGLRVRERHSADHYNCVHGMGHGFMGAFASDVFASLRGCDALADGWERHACHGGVFMENLSAIGHATRPPTALRPREPLYPCTAVAARYRAPCFDKQTTYALYVTDSDFAEVFALCARVERAFRGACYRGLGGDIAVDAAKHVVGARAGALSRRRARPRPRRARGVRGRRRARHPARSRRRRRADGRLLPRARRRGSRPGVPPWPRRRVPRPAAALTRILDRPPPARMNERRLDDVTAPWCRCFMHTMNERQLDGPPPSIRRSFILTVHPGE